MIVGNQSTVVPDEEFSQVKNVVATAKTKKKGFCLCSAQDVRE